MIIEPFSRGRLADVKSGSLRSIVYTKHVQLYSRGRFYGALKKSWLSWISTPVFLPDFIEGVSSNILPTKPRDWPAAKNKGTIRQAISPFVIVQNVNIYGTSNTFNSTLEMSTFPKPRIRAHGLWIRNTVGESRSLLLCLVARLM